MRLRRPTDFLVLAALAETGRNVAPNLAHHTGKSRKNVNGRLPILADYGLVDKIGPAEHSGLYEVTSLGEAALAHRDRYGQVDDFEALLEGDEADAGRASDEGTPSADAIASVRPGACAADRSGD